MEKWISVKEKLPEHKKEILVSSGEGINQQQYVAWIESIGISEQPIWQYSWCCGCFVPDTVTHWKPLPEPPEC